MQPSIRSSIFLLHPSPCSRETHKHFIFLRPISLYHFLLKYSCRFKVQKLYGEESKVTYRMLVSTAQAEVTSITVASIS